MPKNTDTAPAFVIKDYTAPVTENPYTAHVAALAEAGDGKVMEITVPNAEATKARNAFQRAANSIDKTARIVETVDADDDSVTMSFRLKPREKPRVGTKSATVDTEPTE